MELADIVARCRKAIDDLNAVSGAVGSDRQVELDRTIRTLYAAIHALPLGPAAPCDRKSCRDKVVA